MMPRPASASPHRARASRTRHVQVESLEGRELLSGPGSLDTTFGSGGVVATSFSGKDAGVDSLLLQPDGKLVAVGSGMARYNANGTLDTSFGSKGTVAAAAGAGALYPAGTPNAGKIVTGSSASTKNGSDFSLTRYTTGGGIDTSFGSKGSVTTTFGRFAWIKALAVQADGRVLAAGGTQTLPFNSGGVQDLALARYNADGSLDTSFGSGGKVVTDAGAWRLEEFNALTIQADGKIVAAGESEGRFVVVRYNTNGALDASFGPDHTGVVVVSAGGDANALAIQADGKLLVGGYNDYARRGDYQQWALARLNADGTLDATFGTGGVVNTQVTATPDGSYSIMALGVQADGKILAAGNTDGGLSLVRYDTSGALDPGFGAGGVVTTPVPGSGGSETHALVIQPDGKVVLGGKARIGSRSQFALARYIGGGTTGLSVSTATPGTGAIAGPLLPGDHAGPSPWAMETPVSRERIGRTFQSSSRFLGQSSLRRRDSERSARMRPPVWQPGQ